MTTEQLYQLFIQHPVVTTDSRSCPPGSIFFALRGASFDGNDYAAKALEAGSALAVVDRPEVATDERYILVDDALEALQQLAAHHRRQWGGPVLQITGTNGKTTTKELVTAVLAQKFCMLSTRGNLNNHIGVPLTLLRLRPEHNFAVIETGANHPGEIARLSSIVEADCGLITNVGVAHLEGFGSFAGVQKAKGELYDNLHQRQKTVFLNAFDDVLLSMALTRGFHLGEDALPYVEGRVDEINPFLCAQWRTEPDEPWHRVQTHLVGAYNISNVRAAVTVGLHFGVEPELIDQAIAQYEPTNNRSEYRRTERNALIIDAYNANPTSMAAALTNFQFIEAERKMVILGEMRELGETSLEEHRRLLHLLAENGPRTAWLVGDEFREAAGTDSTYRLFHDVEEVKEQLRREPLEGYTILIKGSNGNRLFELPELL